eukprot:9475003-Pyramimonas_sp.AAC.1
MSGYAVYLARKYNDGTVHAKRRLAVAEILDRFYCILKSQDMFLTPSAVDELKQLGKRLVILYNALSVEAARSHKKLWKMVPKFHLWLHLCETQASFMNP